MHYSYFGLDDQIREGQHQSLKSEVQNKALLKLKKINPVNKMTLITRSEKRNFKSKYEADVIKVKNVQTGQKLNPSNHLSEAVRQRKLKVT